MRRWIPRFLFGFLRWIRALWLKFEVFTPWRTLRILRAIRLSKHARRQPRDLRMVVFLRDNPNPRETKISQALRDRGWRTVLLHRMKPAFDAERYFDALVQYSDAWDALVRASTFRPIAYHVSSSWDFRTAEILIRYPPGKVVFDNTDQLAGLIKPSWLWKVRPFALAQEKFCLENSDGLRCRDLSTNYPKREMGYRYKGKRILFMDYGWGISSSELNQPDSEALSIAFCGGLAFEKRNPEQKYNHFLRLFKALTSQGIHVHVYPGISYFSGGLAEMFAEYLKWARECPFLHIHSTVSPDQMPRELSRYHFGLFVWGNLLHLGKDDLSSHPRRMDYSIGSRFFDYTEAGLFVLCAQGRTPKFLLRRYGLGTVASEALYSDAPAWLRQCLRGRELREAIRDEWTMPRQIHRLEAFYRSL